MIKIHDTVEEIVFRDAEALHALTSGYMNLSAYAKQIHQEVENQTKKEVKPSGIVVSLSRIQEKAKKASPLQAEVKLKNITLKSPLTEICFEKSSETLSALAQLHKKLKLSSEDFLTVIQSTSEINITCSTRLVEDVKRLMQDKPTMTNEKLAAIGLSLDPKYYPLPNITYSLIRKIARKRIPLAETFTTRKEIVFTFSQDHIADIVSLFEVE